VDKNVTVSPLLPWPKSCRRKHRELSSDGGSVYQVRRGNEQHGYGMAERAIKKEKERILFSLSFFLFSFFGGTFFGALNSGLHT
jgi:hypothetical protein